jgi:hypothetical protein
LVQLTIAWFHDRWTIRLLCIQAIWWLWMLTSPAFL